VKPQSEVVPRVFEEPYNIGKSQNLPINIVQFVQKHAGDPAVKVSSSHAAIRLMN
jgi:hypothetical protein